MKRAIALALAIAASVGTVYAFSRGSWEHVELADARRLTIDEGFWEREGFVELTTPLAPPTARNGGSRIEVWVRIPEGAKITLDAHGALVLPPGSEADRVERLRVNGKWVIGDVRGARMADGVGGNRSVRWLRLLRPRRTGSDAELVGYEWPDSRPDLGRAVHEAIGDLIRHGGGLARNGGDREALASLLASRSGCVRCHARRQSERTHESQGGPYRATDSLGWYTPLAVLRDAAPLERYRPRDVNADDPFVRIECPEGEPTAVEDDRGGRFFRCEDRALPRGTFDVAAASSAGDAHAAALCESRRYLAAHMDDATRALFSEPLAACSL